MNKKTSVKDPCPKLADFCDIIVQNVKKYQEKLLSFS